MYDWESYSGISGENGYRKVDTGSTSFVRFRQEATGIANDLLAVPFLAQGDAYDTGFGLLKTNVLEFLLETGDIASLVGSPFDMVSAFYSNGANPFMIKNGVSGVVKFIKLWLDMCTDATLLYSFMINPNLKLALEVSSKAQRLLQSFDLFFGWQDINGKAQYTVGGELPYFTGSHVVGRAKMRVRIPPDSVLAALMPLDRLGVLPTFSRYWETLHLSFLIDWFFNVKSKLDVIDKTMKFMALDVAYVTNSVTLYKPIVPTNFQVEDDSSYKYYVRFVLPAAQVFTPTRLAVLGSSGIPSWLSAGSLFYKLGT
jgi:hypothetical protein